VFILNFEPVTIGAHACLSQRAFLCGGNHDYRDPTFRYRNAVRSRSKKEHGWVRRYLSRRE
jgi:acetyltransferase-like isoleucine patch superfamily enzyme